MFGRARRRLTLVYVLIFALLFGIFSLAFYVTMSLVLEPDFDVDPAATTDRSEHAAYTTAIDRVGVALLVADGVVISVVGLTAWALAGRTLRPIRETHERQRRFVADASHELRTPLSGIKATTEAVLNQHATPDQLRGALTSVLDSTDRLTRVSNDLLSLAAAVDRGVERRHDPFDLSVAVAEAIETERSARGGRPAEARLAPDLIVNGDPDEVSRIVRNLVDNAYMHGGPGVGVRVTTRQAEREVVVEVADDGVGIPPEDRARVFEPFFRGRRDAAAPAGSGLGLAIAADLAVRNGGTLSVLDEAGKGTIFRLVLPRFR
jgi:signal transduction histidine kinase